MPAALDRIYRILQNFLGLILQLGTTEHTEYTEALGLWALLTTWVDYWLMIPRQRG